jgi:diguanylate cyclase (GGDEF)-like protein
LKRLAAADFDVLTANSAEAAQAVLAERRVDLILSDQKLPGKTGIQFLEWVRDQSPSTMRLIMTGMPRFEDAVDAINAGQVHRYLFKPWRADELLEILRSASRAFQIERGNGRLLEELGRLNQELEERVVQRTQELQQANHQLQQQNLMLQKLALTDQLTGLPNRRAMDQLIRSELRRRTRYASPLALGLIDVDHFKEVNSRYLLPGGDQVLIGLAKTFISSVRTVDTVGRIGGEEFMVVAPETGLDGVEILGERIRSAVESSRYMYHECPISVTVSIGFGVVDDPMPIQYEHLKHAAALALGEAKGQGRNRCLVRLLSPGESDSEVTDVRWEPVDSEA